ncbi:DUF2244 domain-containing protein [Microbulbifer sp. OS29]|uniref:DUF2244 domain-containing protein n=1 Tax=Microbulbifer okhotskensis TaxID=2926617 RepID=A0A9X2EQV1_9GAMM|nr:DUF2244 domain-containing protein [Microbulbifer okhotskensis]MCO1333981.1 DUF2244 domain-containing protein [Microbulbifer okhotskensis]
MVTEVGRNTARCACILLQPNQSLSLSGNLWVFFSLVGVSLGISLAFAFAGAWMILPFAGLEIILLAVLFTYVYLDGTRREVIRISESQVILDCCKGMRQKTVYHREFDRDKLSVLVRMGASSTEPAIVNFSGPEGCLEVGEFLTEAEKAELVQKLDRFGICARKEKVFRLHQF